jgi:hypothetical protein
MIDVFHAIHACGDLISYWDVAARGDGVLLHARSRVAYPSEKAASEAAVVIAARIQPHGYDVQEVTTQTRSGERGVGWQAFVEVFVS